MTRQVQTILYHTLPIVFWLLAVVGCVSAWFFAPFPEETDGLRFFLPGVLVLIALVVIGRLERHTSSVEPCFRMGLLVGLAAYWMPSVVLVVLPLWGVLLFRNLFSFRSFLATLFGLAFVAIWVAVFCYIGIIETPSLEGRDGVGFLPWIPTGAFAIAYIGSTIVRQTLRVR